MLEELNMFTVVVEQSSMNKASAALNLSQPALSRKIAKLEQDLGTLLFRRIGKRLELTRIGQLTYDYAVEARQQHLRFLKLLAEYKHTGRSTFTIGASLTTLQTSLPDLIQGLTAHSPELDIKAITGKTHEIVTLVRDRKADLGIVASRIEDSQLNCVPLFDDHLVLVLPVNHFIMEKSAPVISDLNGMPMILFSKGTWYRVMTDELFERHRLLPDVRMEIDSFEAILRLLHTCRAATLLPKSYLRQQMLADNDLQVVPIRELQQSKRTTSLIYDHLESFSPAVREWINEISSHYKPV
ncbi:LysR family transcriptional regulator [Paenibacillus sacheonensis]|uniref:LysR family transcriptional regulator n=1 Tax=Paenibacillus sacheonensis TaxID=742054 RepID=A0A7X5C1T9_9BACL|nr:LysR family transcriptional regulator [Paenibacillus sacheonensis]MBM7567463.1 DNA-binding transcriptional LysR family regulator [Paenibacillus sacheonensis]NBC69754.1 LysR family transcriptional regulator [Paenibacillus sacheonensis]